MTTNRRCLFNLIPRILHNGYENQTSQKLLIIWKNNQCSNSLFYIGGLMAAGWICQTHYPHFFGNQSTVPFHLQDAIAHFGRKVFLQRFSKSDVCGFGVVPPDRVQVCCCATRSCSGAPSHLQDATEHVGLNVSGVAIITTALRVFTAETFILGSIVTLCFLRVC